jgi:hypothetical protein
MSNAKATIHQLIDALSDEEADRMLVYLQSFTKDATSANLLEGLRVSDFERALFERTGPIADDDPLWSLVGVPENGPNDASANHDA